VTIDPGWALGLYPCVELDVFIFRHFLDGPDLPPGASIPAVSRAFGSCHMVLVKLIMEYGNLDYVRFSPDYFVEAKQAGHINRKTNCPVWKTAIGGKVGYGRTFQESLCKLGIVLKYDPSLAVG
jgi:hypothetical protein